MVSGRLTSAEREEKYQRLTLEALADVDAGNVIDHHAVQAWVESLDSHPKSRSGEPE